MHNKRTDRIRPFLLLGFFLFAWILLPGLFKSWIRTGFYEFQAPSWAFHSFLGDIQEYWALRSFSKNQLIENNIDMARKLAAQELALADYERIKHDLERTEKLLDIPTLQEYDYLVARVVRRRQNNWWQRLILRKGRFHGVQVNDPVVSSEGLIGKVIQVNLYTSTVELLTNPGFRFSASLVNDDRPLEYLGIINAFPGEPVGEVRFIPPDIQHEDHVSRRMMTSGLGGIFPRGIPVGEIIEMEMGSEGLYQRGKVRLPSSMNTLMEAAILIPKNREHEEPAP